METLLVCLLAGYGVWLTVYLWWERRQREHPASQPDVTSLEREDDVPDIIGKSSFKMRAITPIAANPTPQAATESKTESATEKAPTFAAGTDNRTSARIPDEELDEWRKHLNEFPKEWINGYDKKFAIKEQQLYDLKAIPTLYLLNKEKTVLLKDAPAQAIEEYLLMKSEQ